MRINEPFQDEQKTAKSIVNDKENGPVIDGIDSNDPVHFIRCLLTNLGGKASISDLCQVSHLSHIIFINFSPL